MCHELRRANAITDVAGDGPPAEQWEQFGALHQVLIYLQTSRPLKCGE